MRLIKVVFEKIWLVLAIMVALFAIITGEVKRMKLEGDEKKERGDEVLRRRDNDDVSGG